MNEDIEIRKMNVKDVVSMRSFGKNKNRLLRSYDFWPRTLTECAYWYYKKTEKQDRRYFVASIKGKIIAYISSKDIDVDEGTSVLGLVLDPNFQSAGYGKRIMEKFLERYFEDYGFDEMTLTVDMFNERAIRLYKSLGFKVVGRGYQIFDGERWQISKDDEKFFVFKKGRILSKMWKMKISYEDFYHETEERF